MTPPYPQQHFPFPPGVPLPALPAHPLPPPFIPLPTAPCRWPQGLLKFFRELYKGGDENTQRAMLKSMQESGALCAVLCCVPMRWLVGRVQGWGW